MRKTLFARRILLATELSFKSFFSRPNLLRITLIILIPLIVSIPFGNPYRNHSTAEFVGESSFIIGRISIIILIIAIILAGSLFTSRSSRLQIRAMFSHPVNPTAVYVSQYSILWFVLFLIQSVAAFSTLTIYWSGSTSTQVLNENPYFLIQMIPPVIITASVIAFLLCGLFILISVLFNRADAVIVSNLLLTFIWALLSGMLGGRDIQDYPLGLFSPHGFIRNSLYQLSGVSFPGPSVLESFLGYPFTIEILYLQLGLFVAIGMLSMVGSYIIFRMKSKNW